MITQGKAAASERRERKAPVLVDAVRLKGTEHRDRGLTAKAQPLYLESLQLAEMMDFDSGRAHALNCLGSIEQRRGNLDASSRYFEASLGIATRYREPRLVGMLQQNLGVIADIRGNSAAALAYYRASLTTLDTIGDRGTTLKVLNNIGYLYVKDQRDDEARSILTRAVTIAREFGDLMCEGIV